MNETLDIEQLKFPVGRFQLPENYSQKEIDHWIAEIAALPAQLRRILEGATMITLDTPYRPGGWTVRQVVHHVADSHINAYTRFKLALTEVEPQIKPYDEGRWAELPDTFATPVEVSLQLIAALHQRWVILLKNLDEKDYKKIFLHPEHGTAFRLDETIANYAWHGRHHLGHIELVVKPQHLKS